MLCFLLVILMPSVHARDQAGACSINGYAAFVNSGDDKGTQYGSDNNPDDIPPDTEILVVMNLSWSTQMKQHDLEIRWKNTTSSFASVEAEGVGNGWKYWDSTLYAAATLDDAPTAHFSGVERWTHDIQWSGYAGNVPSNAANLGFVLEHWAMVKTPSTPGNYELDLYDYEGSVACTIAVQVSITVASVDASPTVTLSIPPDDTANSSTQFTLGCNVTDNYNIANTTLYIWNSTGVWNNTEINTSTGTSLNYTWLISNFVIDDYLWNCLSYDNASQSSWAGANFSLNVNGYWGMDFLTAVIK